MTIDYDEMCLVLAVEDFQRFTFHMRAAVPILGLLKQSLEANEFQNATFQVNSRYFLLHYFYTISFDL